ncbi:MAG TPA: hypothetical protein VMH41_16905 [Mycobacteriales bacterium]|nr:hypothetical protein [Mycobacteriales bacterium]
MTDHVSGPTGSPSPFELWEQAKGDRAEYLRLMEQHGHLVPGEREPGRDIFGHAVSGPTGEPGTEAGRLDGLDLPWPEAGDADTVWHLMVWDPDEFAAENDGHQLWPMDEDEAITYLDAVRREAVAEAVVPAQARVRALEAALEPTNLMLDLWLWAPNELTEERVRKQVGDNIALLAATSSEQPTPERDGGLDVERLHEIFQTNWCGGCGGTHTMGMGDCQMLAAEYARLASPATPAASSERET